MSTFQLLTAGLVGFIVALPIVLLLTPPTSVVNKFSGKKAAPNVGAD